MEPSSQPPSRQTSEAESGLPNTRNATQPEGRPGLAFASLGLLIGLLVSMTESPVVQPFLALLFAFAGGSIIAFIGKVKASDRALAFRTLFALSSACTVGIVIGVVLCEYRLLSPPRPHARTSNEASSPSDKHPYLRGSSSPKVAQIRIQTSQGQLPPLDAAQQIIEHIRTDFPNDQDLHRRAHVVLDSLFDPENGK